MFSRKPRWERELDEAEREQREFEGLSPDGRVAFHIRRQNSAILSELRAIRWSLFILVAFAVIALGRVWPDWWHAPWWPR